MGRREIVWEDMKWMHVVLDGFVHISQPRCN